MDDRELLNLICPLLGEEACSDDCAVLPEIKGIPVVSTDMLHETTDFPSGMTNWQIGWMAMAVTISDLASMGALPKFLTLAIGLDCESRLNDIIKGAHECCQKFGAQYVGGDLDAHTELTLVSTGIGVVTEGKPVRRSGAKPGDLIGVTGIQGRAMAGLKGDRRYWRDLCEPSPRVYEGIAIHQAGATSMMDISDGLAISVHDIMKASGVGCELSRSEIPCLPDYKPDEALIMALFGGGDFELLFTIPSKDRQILPKETAIIGVVTEKQDILLDGDLLPAEGYRHNWNQ
jgi:thiamine-monophosphate kinase